MGLSKGFAAFSRPRAKFTLAYGLAGRKVINGENLLKRNDIL